MAKKIFTDESLATFVDEVKSYTDSAVSTKANSSHNHAASNITSGTLSSDRLPTVPITKGGTGATTAAAALTNLGITATAAELNKLDGVTATTTELNYMDGVTSNVQTQIDTLTTIVNGIEDNIDNLKEYVTLEPIKIEGYIDLPNYDYDLTFTDENYQQFLKNKTAPLLISEKLYYPYWDFGEGEEDGSFLVYYRQADLYLEGTLNEAIIGILWLPNGETLVDETMNSEFNISLEPIYLDGSVLFDNGFSTNIEYGNITSTHYRQFLQNKNSPLCVDGLIFNLETITDMGDGNYYAQYFYINAIGGTKCYICVCWETDDWYVDESYSEGFRITGGKAVLSYTVQYGQRFDIPPTDTVTINKYGVENIIFKIDDGEGYTYYYELTSLSDDGFYNFDQHDLELEGSVLRRIELSNDFSTISHLSIPIGGSSGESDISLEPINLGGTITGWGENFGTENVVITQAHYQQFLRNKNAPILIETSVFYLDSITDEGEGNYYCLYSRFEPFYASKAFVVICWYNDESYVEESYIDRISGIKPIDIDKRITGWGEDFSLINVRPLYNTDYMAFLNNKYAPILVDNIVFQLESLVDNGDDTYTATYYYISVDYKYYVVMCWENNASDIDETYVEPIGGSSYIITGAKSGTTIGSCATAEGSDTTASGDYSHAEGGSTIASGIYSHAEGGSTTASGSASHAEGDSTTAFGEFSHAEGSGTYASGVGSHAEGGETTASGDLSHAEGAETTASGAYSHAEGMNTIASGLSSHAGGIGTIANDYQYVVGKYNASTTAPTSLTDTATSTGLFIVGIGSSDTARSNGFRVSAGGKVYGTGVFGTSGADYAEYFEWFDGNPNNEDRRGRFVTLDGGKIRYATSNDDYILGVVSANPSVAGDIQSESWHNMYFKDIYGSKLVEVVEVEETTNENGEIIPAHTERRWVLNPDYNPDVKYISREERPEWAAIGIVGKLVVVDDGTCQVNGYCYPNVDGIVTASQEKTNYRVMERLDDTHIRIFIR